MFILRLQEFSPGSNGRMTTMGVYIRDLLLGQVRCYLNSDSPVLLAWLLFCGSPISPSSQMWIVLKLFCD